MRFLKNGRASWQRAWETEIGTTVQNDKETVTRHYVVDYLSIANRDIFVTEDGSYTSRYVYDASGRRISAEFDYAPGTKRGEAGENLQSDIAVSIGKVFYRTSILGSTLFAVDKDGNQVAYAIYDPWGKALTETYTDANYSGLENLNNFTGYTWDVTLALYFAQNRFYDASNHRFTQEDAAKDGANWYVYCGNEPMLRVDVWGEDAEPVELWYETMWWLTLTDGPIPIGDIVYVLGGLVVLLTAKVILDGNSYYFDTASCDNERNLSSGNNKVEIVKVETLPNIARKYKKFQCREAAEEMKRQYPNGKIIMLHFPYAHNGFVMSERYPFAISENGLHYGFSYNGRTYCNIYPEGRETGNWINSFFDASGIATTCIYNIINYI